MDNEFFVAIVEPFVEPVRAPAKSPAAAHRPNRSKQPDQRPAPPAVIDGDGDSANRDAQTLETELGEVRPDGQEAATTAVGGSGTAVDKRKREREEPSMEVSDELQARGRAPPSSLTEMEEQLAGFIQARHTRAHCAASLGQAFLLDLSRTAHLIPCQVERFSGWRSNNHPEFSMAAVGLLFLPLAL